MGWVRISDDFYDNEKMGGLGPVAIALWLACIAYCNRNLTDGFIPRVKVRGLLDCSGVHYDGENGPVADAAEAAIIELEQADILHRKGHGCDICRARQGREGNPGEPDGRKFLVHDYLEYQMSRAEIEAKSEANRQRVQAWRERQKNTIGNGVRDESRNGASTDLVQTPQPQPQPQPQEELSTQVSSELTLVEGSGETPAKAGRRRKKPSTPLPEGFFPSEASVEKIKSEFPGVSSETLTIQHRKFCDHALQNDRRCVEWDSAWRNWMRGAGERGTLGGGTRKRTNDDKIAALMSMEVPDGSGE